MAGAGAILLDLRQLRGIELTHGIRYRAADGAIDFDPSRPQAQQGAGSDSAHNDRIRPCAREGFHRAARAVNMRMVTIGYRFDGQRLRVHQREGRGGPEMPVYGAFQSVVFRNRYGDSHISPLSLPRRHLPDGAPCRE